MNSYFKKSILPFCLLAGIPSARAGAQHPSPPDTAAVCQASRAAEPEYEYDKNGNLTKDLNRSISKIEYNCLNLPQNIVFMNGNSIQHEYLADGTLVRTIYKVGGKADRVVDYCGNAIYENDELKMLLNEAGYVSMPDKKFYFYIKDHQGNIRAVADAEGNAVEVNDYYPLGGLMSGTASNGFQPYKYNGKELERANGLNEYNYGARRYDPMLGRWHVPDPMAEQFPWVSPYAYCDNNPVNRIDPDGRQVRPARPPIRRGYHNGGRPNPYAFYPRGVRPPSYRQSATFAYRGNGLIEKAAMDPQNILRTLMTPGGNEVQMSNGNEVGTRLSGYLDLWNNYKEFRDRLVEMSTSVHYQENGMVSRDTHIIFHDPITAARQLEYDRQAAFLNKQWGELDFSGKNLNEILIMQGERQKMIEEKLGLSPLQQFWIDFFQHPESFEMINQNRTILPEFHSQ